MITRKDAQTASAVTEVKIFAHQPSKKQFESVEAKQVVDTCGHQMLSILLHETLSKELSQVYVSKASKPLQNSKHLLQSLDSITLAHNGSWISFEYFWFQLALTGSCHANYCGFEKLSRTNSSWTESRVFDRELAEEPQAGIAVSIQTPFKQ